MENTQMYIAVYEKEVKAAIEGEDFAPLDSLISIYRTTKNELQEAINRWMNVDDETFSELPYWIESFYNFSDHNTYGTQIQSFIENECQFIVKANGNFDPYYGSINFNDPSITIEQLDIIQFIKVQ